MGVSSICLSIMSFSSPRTLESIDSSFKPMGFIAETCMAITFKSSEISEAFFKLFVEISTTDAIFEQEELYLLCK